MKHIKHSLNNKDKYGREIDRPVMPVNHHSLIK